MRNYKTKHNHVHYGSTRSELSRPHILLNNKIESLGMSGFRDWSTKHQGATQRSQRVNISGWERELSANLPACSAFVVGAGASGTVAAGSALLVSAFGPNRRARASSGMGFILRNVAGCTPGTATASTRRCFELIRQDGPTALASRNPLLAWIAAATHSTSYGGFPVVMWLDHGGNELRSGKFSLQARFSRCQPYETNPRHRSGCAGFRQIVDRCSRLRPRIHEDSPPRINDGWDLL
jgi:hypothetical protein